MPVPIEVFVPHYMAPMFLDPDQPPVPNGFLDQVVAVDEDTVNRREAATLDELALRRKETGLQFGNGERVADGSASGADILTFDRTRSGRLMVEEATGKTVRELSRLWKYQGGRSPE